MQTSQYGLVLSFLTVLLNFCKVTSCPCNSDNTFVSVSLLECRGRSNFDMFFPKSSSDGSTRNQGGLVL